MVPPNGIEPLIADYKAAVMPFNYKGVRVVLFSTMAQHPKP